MFGLFVFFGSKNGNVKLWGWMCIKIAADQQFLKNFEVSISVFFLPPADLQLLPLDWPIYYLC